MAKAKKNKKKKKKQKTSGKSKGQSIQKELKELESAWDEAEERSGDFAEIPDGRYQVEILGANINRSKNSERLQVSFEFKIISGEHKNRKVWEHMGLETAENLGWIKTIFARLGKDIPASLADLPESLEEILGMTIEVTVKTKGDFQNVYINKPISRDDDVEEDSDDWEGDESEDDSDSGDEDDEESEEEDDEDEEEEDDEEEEEEPDDEDEEEEDEEDEEEDEDEDVEDEDDEDEEEEEEEPAPKKKRKKKAAPKKKKKKTAAKKKPKKGKKKGKRKAKGKF